MPVSTTYALDNSQPGAGTSLSWLAQILDPTTLTILKPLIQPGDHVLELGAGVGSIARRAADIVTTAGPLNGRLGLVVATDLDPVHLTQHPGVRVFQHDLRTDPVDSIDGGPWDLIHARCLLAHLGNRDQLVPQLADALAPGGHLVIEEWGAVGAGSILHAPTRRAEVLYTFYQQALMATLRDNGNDGTWIKRVHQRMVEAGLEASTITSARSWDGGSAGCKLPIALSGQIEGDLLAHGMKIEDLRELRELLANPNLSLIANLTWSFIGRKPLAED